MSRNSLLLVTAAMSLCLQHSVAQNSEPKLATLNRPAWDRLNFGSYLPTQLDLIHLRSDPSLLDNKAFMRYFIVLNNCGNADVVKNLDNEFEYPPMVAFYKPKALDIVNFVPNSFSISLGFGFQLGEYDTTRKAFPFIDNQHRSQAIVFRNVTPYDSGQSACPGIIRLKIANQPTVFPAYMVTFKEVKFTEVAVAEAAARAYVAGLAPVAQSSRFVEIQLDIEILSDPPQTVYGRNGETYVTFAGELKKATVLFSNSTISRKLLGVLYPRR